MGQITFNGISSIEFPHFHVEKHPSYSIPKKVYEVTHIPGKSGDVYFDTGEFENVEMEYDVNFGSYYKRYPEMFSPVAGWLSAPTGYCRLEDSYDPEHYRLAVFSGGVEFENVLNHAGKAKIKFDCKPQRYLKDGENPIVFTAAGYIHNPTWFDAKPYIKVYGSGNGTLRIENLIITFTGIDSYIELDSEIQDAYKGTVNCNSKVSMEEFPTLGPGVTNVSFTGGITKVEITPRWWEV